MRYTNATTENLSEKTTEAIKSSIQNGKGLFIFGGTGTGKTYTLHALAETRGDVENFVSLLVEFRDYMHKGYYFDRMNEFANREYLFIDDIGSEKISEFVIEFLYLVVNRRYENMKRTVLTTNLSLKDFQERYGDRILSRISEMCVLLELEGEDKRLD